MFYAIMKNKIDLRRYRFEHRLEEIQPLNERARGVESHISAIPSHAYVYVAGYYALLPCGASIGERIWTTSRKKPSNVEHQKLSIDT